MTDGRQFLTCKDLFIVGKNTLNIGEDDARYTVTFSLTPVVLLYPHIASV